MKLISTKTLLQTTAVLLTSFVLLGCPIDDDDIFTGDVTVINSTGGNLEYVTIQETGAAVGANFGALGNGLSATYSGYDCATSYVNTVRVTAGGGDNNSADFIPPCGGTETITWTVVVP